MPLTPDEAVDQTRRLLEFHDAERSRLDTIRRYWKGRQSLPAVIPSAAPLEVRRMAQMARVNVCDIVVDSLTQSLFVDGFHAEQIDENGQPVDRNVDAWGVWQANKFDARQTRVNRPTLAYGTGYVLVLPGDPVPVWRARSPRKLTAMYGEDQDWPMWALERQGNGAWRLYDDEAVYFMGEETDRADGSRNVVYLDTRTHGQGVCPVVRFVETEDDDLDDEPPVDWRSEDRLVAGQVAPLIPLQDQIDLTTFSLLVAQHYGAFKQRYILGWVAETEAQKMEAAASRIWTFEDHPDDMEIGELTETRVDGYIQSREASLRHAATLSQTPVHELIGELVNLSSEALAAAEAGRDRKVDERKTVLGESYEQLFRLTGRMVGEDIPFDAEVVWRDTSARSFAAVVDGLGKLAEMLQIPPQELWREVPGVTQQDVRRWKAAAEAGTPLSFFTEQLERQMTGNGQVEENVVG